MYISRLINNLIKSSVIIPTLTLLLRLKVKYTRPVTVLQCLFRLVGKPSLSVFTEICLGHPVKPLIETLLANLSVEYQLRILTIVHRLYCALLLPEAFLRH